MVLYSRPLGTSTMVDVKRTKESRWFGRGSWLPKATFESYFPHKTKSIFNTDLIQTESSNITAHISQPHCLLFLDFGPPFFNNIYGRIHVLPSNQNHHNQILEIAHKKLFLFISESTLVKIKDTQMATYQNYSIKITFFFIIIWILIIIA